MAALIEGLEAVSVHVTQIERSRRFYAEVLGLTELVFERALSRAVFEIPGSTTRLTMHPMAPGEGGREPGTVSGLVFLHHDPPSAVEEIRRRGGTIVAEPQTFAQLGFTRAVIADPDGNEFILASARLAPTRA
jgi:predicted enzyme related to lactoylglutathione lyase